MTTTLAAQDSQIGAPPVLRDGAEALATARALLPRIRQRAEQADAQRRLPDETIEDLLASGLFGIVAPKLFGGSELGFADLVKVTAELASACASTGWVFGVLAGHSWLLNLFPEEAQHEVMKNPSSLTATVFRLAGEVIQDGGGYRLRGGEGRFCSGIDFADWVIVGNAVKTPSGPEPRFFVVPKQDVEVIDDWHTVGMRGTGSRSIRIADAFIPAHRSCSLKDMLAGASPGARLHQRAVYRMPFSDIAPFSIIGGPLGIARAAVEAFAARVGKELGGADPLKVAEQSARLARLGVASAEIDAALSQVVSNAALLDTAFDPADLSAADRAKFPRDWAWAAQIARNAVNSLFEASGGTTIYNQSADQRIWRDANASAQHFAFTWDTAMTAYGRSVSGLPPSSQAVLKQS